MGILSLMVVLSWMLIFISQKLVGVNYQLLINYMGGIKVMDDWDSRINDELNMERELYKHLHECHVKKEGRK